MSWSITVIGTPENIEAEIEKESARLTGESKVEFDETKPHLVGLLKQNYAKVGGAMVELSANGHGGKGSDGQREYCNCNVSLKGFHTRIV